VERRTYQSIDTAGRRRLNTQRAATLEHGFADVVLTLLIGQHFRDKPSDELVAIPDRRLAEAQKLANLDAVILDRAARPLVARIQFARNADLLGHVDNDRAG
jgi:hypothetical protein